MLLGVANALPYKWASTAPITYVDISNIQDIEKLDYYLNSDGFVVIYTGKDFAMTSHNEEILEYIGLVEPKNTVNQIPYFGNSTFVVGDQITPEDYVYRDENGAYVFINSNVGSKEETTVFEAEISSKVYDDGFYEIKPRKLFIPYEIDLENKDLVDFIGAYVAENNETFVYINKVPSGYDQVVINAIAVQNIIPDENGDSAISVADRKITVEVRDEAVINKKIQQIKAISELLGTQTTYITTGSENIDIIRDDSITDDEKEDLLNSYWFKKHYSDYYTNIKYDDKYSDYPNVPDILAMSYYPLIYVDKAPETFDNDPTGGYYPEAISYSGSESLGYWDEGPGSENNYYHYDGEDYWNEDETVSREYWSTEGDFASMSEEIDFNDRYEYFEHWYVKNYAYAMTEDTDGILLFTNDKSLLDSVFNKDNKNISWKLNIDGMDYVVLPDYIGYDRMNGMSVIKIPGLNNNEINGVHVIEEIYLEPYNEEYGVYVADVIEFDTNKLYELNDNHTWLCSFKEYANWAEEYRTSSLTIKNNTIYVNADENAKITIFKKGVTRVKGTSTESYDASGKLVIAKVPEIISLNNWGRGIMRLGFYNIQGGTGKTTIAANIGHYLSDKTKTIYVDCDIYAGCGALLFGFEDTPHTLNSYLSGNSALTDIIHQYDDLSVIVSDSTPNSFNTEINQKRMLELIRVLNDNYDIVLLDLPPNITEGNLLFSSLNLEEKVVNKMIIVAEDSIPGIANTMKTKELLFAIDIDCIGVIVNKYRDLVDFEDALDDIIAILPYDQKVENQWMENVPAIQRKSKFSKELSYLAEDLAEVYIKKDLAAVRALKVAKELKDMTAKKVQSIDEDDL